MTTLLEPEIATTTGAPPRPLKRHIVDRLPTGRVAERTVCGKPWDRAYLAPQGEPCEACCDVLRERGHGHMIPFIGRSAPP